MNENGMTQGKWPKTYRPLTDEEKRIKDDFMHYWHEVLPKKYGIVEIFNHNYPANRFKKIVDKKHHWRTIELGGV